MCSPDYLWLTDADISYAPDVLTQLVVRARDGNRVLTSVMARLHCESWVERAFMPAFVYFFQMLYPYTWVNNARVRLAAAAGGCMLVRQDTLHAAGGLAPLHACLIDDCALARALKPHGPIWLGASSGVRSLRAYSTLREICAMVARTAYCQLRYSLSLLTLTAVGLSITFVAPLGLAFGASGVAQWMSIGACALMALSFLPTLRKYRLTPLWVGALPVIALVYLSFTLYSAWQHYRGSAGLWKGRAQGALRRSRSSSTTDARSDASMRSE